MKCHLPREQIAGPCPLPLSAGGITVGGALTWRPDLFVVVLDPVGISDTESGEGDLKLS